MHTKMFQFKSNLLKAFLLMYFSPTLIFPLGWTQEHCGAYRQFQPQKSITCSSECSFPPFLRTDKDLNLNIWEEMNSLFHSYPHHVLSDRWVSGGHMDDYRWLNPQQHDSTPTEFPWPSRHRCNMEKQLHLQHRGETEAFRLTSRIILVEFRWFLPMSPEHQY